MVENPETRLLNVAKLRTYRFFKNLNWQEVYNKYQKK